MKSIGCLVRRLARAASPACLLVAMAPGALVADEKKGSESVAAPKVSDPYAAADPVEAAAYPIDLATALRLADTRNPSIALAQARVREALARVDQANVLFLPTLTAGSSYFRHDGVDQNRRGDIFTVSRSNVFVGGAPRLRVDLADAFFQPLVARRLSQAEIAAARAVRNNVSYDAASAYLDLLQANAALAINADTLARAEQMLNRAKVADEAGLAKTKGDVNRAQTEVNLRKQERLDLQGRIGATSARLARVLFLQESVDLTPVDPAVVPITLVPPQPLEDLIALAMASRPELAASRSVIGATRERERQARLTPFIPRLQLEYLGGEFAGGRNSSIGDLQARGDLTAEVVWELRNLGLGNRATVRERQAVRDQAVFRSLEVESQVRAEVLEAAKIAASRFRALDTAQESVRQASELYRKLLDSLFGMLNPNRQYDAVEVLLAIQSLNQARVQYLTQVIEFDRAQFRLYTALGQPAVCSLDESTQTELAVPVLPASGPPPPPAKFPGLEVETARNPTRVQM